MRIFGAITVSMSGISLIIAGVAMWNIPAAMIVAGICLLIIGGLGLNVDSDVDAE